MVEGGMTCVRYLLIIFNLIFFIAGIGILASGIYVKVELDDYYDFFGNDYVGPGIFLIVVGVIILLIAFFGCFGAIKSNYCLIMTFAVLLAVIFILEIAAGIYGFTIKDEVEDDITKVMIDAQQNYGVNEGVTKTWNKLHDEFDCCGVKNSSEWEAIPGLESYPPNSCCYNDAVNCTYESVLMKKGCEPALEDWLTDKIDIIGGVAIGLAFIQIVGIVFACCLARAIKKEYEGV